MTLQANQTVCQLISKGYFSQAKDRINNRTVNDVDQDGRTALILCSFIEEHEWSLSLARFLIQLGARISIRDSLNQMNVFHYCCILERVELLELLLESVDFDINAGDNYGNSPFICAIAIDGTLLIDALVKFYKRYKINVDKTNLRGVNALMQASLNGNIELIRNLMNMGADISIKDCDGKSAAKYKEEATSKYDNSKHSLEHRRQSRMVKFDDIKKHAELKEETIAIQQGANNLTEVINKNSEIVKVLQTKFKRLKRNKIDFAYVSKCFTSSNVEREGKRFRPKTALTSKELSMKGDWYSIVRPLFITLEQQNTASFRIPSKHDESSPLQEILVDKLRNRGRRASRSMGSLSRKNSVCGRMLSNEDGSDNVFVTPKAKKKLDAIVSAKAVIRNFSRIGNRSATNA